jgi:hypothetical protein
LLYLKQFCPPVIPMLVKSPWIASGYVKIAIETCTFIVDLPIQDGDFP